MGAGERKGRVLPRALAACLAAALVAGGIPSPAYSAMAVAARAAHGTRGPGAVLAIGPGITGASPAGFPRGIALSRSGLLPTAQAPKTLAFPPLHGDSGALPGRDAVFPAAPYAPAAEPAPLSLPAPRGLARDFSVSPANEAILPGLDSRREPSAAPSSREAPGPLARAGVVAASFSRLKTGDSGPDSLKGVTDAAWDSSAGEARTGALTGAAAGGRAANGLKRAGSAALAAAPATILALPALAAAQDLGGSAVLELGSSWAAAPGWALWAGAAALVFLLARKVVRRLRYRRDAQTVHVELMRAQPEEFKPKKAGGRAQVRGVLGWFTGHPGYPAAIFGPAALGLLASSLASGGWAAAAYFTGGLLLASLAEYLIHRGPLHLLAWPSSKLHLAHHHEPADARQIIQSPFLIAAIALPLYAGFRLLFGAYGAGALAAAALLWYILYELFHFVFHAHPALDTPLVPAPLRRLIKLQQRLHLRHHTVTPDLWFGVTNPLWDWVFDTDYWPPAGVLRRTAAPPAARPAELPPEEIAARVERARIAQRAWSELGVRDRVRTVRRFWAYLESRREELAEVLRRETGKPAAEIEIMELSGARGIARFFLRVARRVLEPRLSLPWYLVNKRASLRHIPAGVVGLITPWNFPFLIPAGDAIPALLAGNAVLLKPSEATPETALVFERLVRESGLFPEGLFQVLPGGGKTGAAVVESADMVLFTGSTETGEKVRASAEARGIPHVLELGGQHAMIVLADAAVGRAAQAAVMGAFANCGQACIGVEKVYVAREIHAPFVAAVLRELGRLRAGRDYGRMIVPEQLAVVDEHLKNAAAKGAILVGRGIVDRKKLLVEPTVVLEATQEMRLMREPTFGPLLPIMAVDGPEQALALANADPRGLYGSIWSKDLARAERLGRSLEVGIVGVNEVLSAYALAALPFGGTKGSGIGRRHGEQGLLIFTDRKKGPQSFIVHRWPADWPELWWMPYSRLKTWLVRLLSRWS